MPDEIRILRLTETITLEDSTPVEVLRVEWKLSDVAGPFTDQFPKGTPSSEVRAALEARASELRLILGPR